MSEEMSWEDAYKQLEALYTRLDSQFIRMMAIADGWKGKYLELLASRAVTDDKERNLKGG